jgi:raffinose/stachyose/melibiose transport system permease protein
VVLQCALSGYVLGRFDFYGRRIIVGILGATFVIPAGMTIIPVVDLTQNLGLLGSRWGIILALAGSGHAAGILLYAGYFRRVPKELAEAAMIDGAGFFTIFFRIMLPLASPITATVSVLTFLFAWNSFLIPLVFTSGTADAGRWHVGLRGHQRDGLARNGRCCHIVTFTCGRALLLCSTLSRRRLCRSREVLKG